MYHAQTDARVAYRGAILHEPALALAMAHHPRLGANARTLPAELIEGYLSPRAPWTYPPIPVTRGVAFDCDDLPVEEALCTDDARDDWPFRRYRYKLTFQGDTLMAEGEVRNFVQYVSARVDGQQIYVDMDAQICSYRSVWVRVYHYDYRHHSKRIAASVRVGGNEGDWSFACDLTPDVRLDVWYDPNT
jgi:hypothetical protein